MASRPRSEGALLARDGTRHNLAAGGPGETISLMVLAKGFSRLGVPVSRHESCLQQCRQAGTSRA